MIRFTMMPGEDGDCLLLEYGDDTVRRRILVDGGRAGTYPRIKPVLAETGGRIDVLVVTHVDQDHILGVLAMLKDHDKPVTFGDVWFNGYQHLLNAEAFGAADGEQLGTALVQQKLPWNAAFGGHSIEVGHPPVWFPDGSAVEVLSPDRSQLQGLIPIWAKECARHGLIPGRRPDEIPAVPGFEHFGSAVDVDQLAATVFQPDTSRTNLSSIGLLFEFAGKRIILTGDADDRRLVESLRPRAKAAGGRLHVDILKVAHHGSDHNLSKDLLDLIDCDHYLISTSGTRHAHPDEVAMARILKYGRRQKELVFNYRSRAALWDVRTLKHRFGYTVRAPADQQSDGFIRVDL
ncbi:MBL fold metallo-hydrolase [Streptomyces sp. NPDC005373]|uniref:ComEC/Rec2 family competence protein n=1 Tax=Streptomyces sp. NPDC005373 TaxID=3156879 RepID=UPI0033A32B45